MSNRKVMKVPFSLQYDNHTLLWVCHQVTLDQPGDVSGHAVLLPVPCSLLWATPNHLPEGTTVGWEAARMRPERGVSGFTFV